MAPINIRGNLLDPADPGDITLPPNAADTKYVLVQLNREMDQDTLEALLTHEASVIKRMVGNTWLVHYPPKDLRILETSIPAVEHAFVYVNDLVVHTDLKNNVDDGECHDSVLLTTPVSLAQWLLETQPKSQSYCMRMIVPKSKALLLKFNNKLMPNYSLRRTASCK